MRVVCEKEKLYKALSKARLCLSDSLPVLSYIKVEAGNSCLFFTTTNLEQTIRTECEAEIGGEKKDFCVPGKRFFSVVKELPDSRVELSLEKTLRIKSGKTRFSLAVMDGKEFPEVNIPEFKERIDLFHFIKQLKKVSFCTEESYSREVYKSVFVEKYFVATDGKRLVYMPNEEWEGKEILVPRDFVSILEKIGEDQQSVYAVDNSRLALKVGDTICMTQLVDGKFPDWKSILPDENELDKVYVIDRKIFEEAIKRVSLMSTKETRLVKLRFGNGKLFLSSQCIDGEGEEEIDVEGDKEFKINFNAAYLLEGLGQVDSEKLVMKCKGSIHPALFEPQDDTGWRYLLMPVQLREE